MKVSFDNVHFYEVKLKVDVDKRSRNKWQVGQALALTSLSGGGEERGENKWHACPGSCTGDEALLYI